MKDGNDFFQKLLEEADCTSEELMTLSEISLRRYIQMVWEGILRKDPSRACSTASSAIVKKVLLMKAIQNDFNVRFAPEEITFTAGTTDAIHLVADGLARTFAPGDEIVTTVLEHHSNKKTE